MQEDEIYAQLKALRGKRVLIVPEDAVVEASIIIAAQLGGVFIDPAKDATYFKPEVKIRVPRQL